MNNEEIGT